VAIAIFLLVFSIAAVDGVSDYLSARADEVVDAPTTTSGPTTLCEGPADADVDGLPIGETQRIGDLEVTISSAEFVPLLDDFWSDGYLQVKFAVVNEGDEVVTHRGHYNLALVDLDVSDITPVSYDSESLLTDVDLAPGEGVKGQVSFPVGYVDGTYRLKYQEDGFFEEGDVGYWTVDVDAGRNPDPTDTVIPPPTITPGYEVVRDYDIDILIESGGAARFTETIVYDFSSQLRHGIYRDLVVRQRCNDRYDRIYPLQVLSVGSPSGAPASYVVENQGGMKRIKIGDADQTVTGVQTYEITYRLQGTLNAFDDHDELYWNVIGDQWGVPLHGIDVGVTVPGGADQAACYAGETGSRARCTDAELADGIASFRQGQLYPFQGMTIAVGFPKGAVPEPEPILSEPWSFRRAFTVTPLTLALTGGLTLLVLAAWALLRRVVGGDRRAKGSAIDVAFAPVGTKGTVAPVFGDSDHSPVEFAPPDGIRPALMGVLLYERARPVDVSATIVDLAVRGYVHIEEIRNGKDFKLERQGKDLGDLHPYEIKLMNSLFPSGRSETELSDLDQNFSSKMDNVLDELYDQVVADGWFDVRPDRVRTKWRVRGFFVTLFALIAFIGAIVFTKLALVMLPLVLFGFLVWFGAGAMPRRTAAGTGVYRRSLGFQEFIVDSEAPRARWAEQRNIFSEYLPYAIVLGEAQRWARTFESLGADAVGTDVSWYHGSQPLSVLHLSTSMSNFTATAGTTLTSTPPATSGSSGSSGFSSSSSSSSSSSGSSGGGGGGGGGGSW
jgi:uncharacterized membrane protein